MYCASPSVTASQITVTGLTARLEKFQHNLYMDNCFHLQHYLTIHILKKRSCCETVTANINDNLKNFGQKIKLQQGDIKTKVRGHLTATVWKDKTKCKHTVEHALPTTEGDKNGRDRRAVKLVTAHRRLL
jgi:hypothetical protein